MISLDVLLALALAAPLPTPVSQQAENVAQILRAAASHLQSERLKNEWGVLSVDPRQLPAGQRGPVMTGNLSHPQAVLSTLNVTGVSSIMSVERATKCVAAPDNTECRIEGKVAVVTFSAPTISGDSATVTSLLQVARVPTAADSAQARTATRPSDPEFWLRRMSRPSGQLLRLTLVRSNANWKVTTVTVIGGSQ